MIEECPFCSGLAKEMGRLGKSLWFRCQNCNQEFAEDVDEEDVLCEDCD